MSRRSPAPLTIANTCGPLTSIYSCFPFLPAHPSSSLERIVRPHAGRGPISPGIRTVSESDLIWPAERPRAAAPGSEWSQSRSNLCLDFHGDPASAQLAVSSDGNHHMALAGCVESFVPRTP